MDDWGWRGNLAYWIHRLGYLFYPSEPHELVVRNADGDEVFSLSFSDGFVASGLADEPYKFYCRHYVDDDCEEVKDEVEL